MTLGRCRRSCATRSARCSATAACTCASAAAAPVPVAEATAAAVSRAAKCAVARSPAALIRASATAGTKGPVASALAPSRWRAPAARRGSRGRAAPTSEEHCDRPHAACPARGRRRVRRRTGGRRRRTRATQGPARGVRSRAGAPARPGASTCARRPATWQRAAVARPATRSCPAVAWAGTRRGAPRASPRLCGGATARAVACWRASGTRASGDVTSERPRQLRRRGTSPRRRRRLSCRVARARATAKRHGRRVAATAAPRPWLRLQRAAAGVTRVHVRRAPPS